MADRPSRTSVWAAAARAVGEREPAPCAPNPDWLAEKLIGADEVALLGDHPLGPALSEPYAEAIKIPEVLGGVRLLMARTRFIDSRLEAAASDGLEQLVLMGAGFDSRAYRLAALLQNAKIFEVDRPATQDVKRQRVREAIGEPPANLTYVPVDFREGTLDAALLHAGYAHQHRTFFIWEGVTMYLPADAVHETLRWVAGSAARGSSVVFDYTYDGVIQAGKKIDVDKLPERMKQALERFRRLTAGEPWIFGLPDRDEQGFLHGLGLELRKVMGMNSAEAIERYLTRSDGSIVGSVPPTEQQTYLILEAGVPG
jgi:methyltransferase (TIGR00027 family)